MKFIVSFTTSPTRINKCEIMLQSILNQTRKADLIILNIPKIFQRTGEEYNIPKNFSDKITINIIDRDFGPATKIIPTIKYLNDNQYNINDTCIIYLDDDIKYMNRMIESYEKTILNNDNTVWGAIGFDFIDNKIKHKIKHNSKCSIIEGYAGVCVKLSIFENDFFEYIEKYINDIDCRLSDDVILSNYYHKKNIKINIISIPKYYSIDEMVIRGAILDYGNGEDALHNGANGLVESNFNRYNKVIDILNNNNDYYIKINNKINNNVNNNVIKFSLNKRFLNIISKKI